MRRRMVVLGVVLMALLTPSLIQRHQEANTLHAAIDRANGNDQQICWSCRALEPTEHIHFEQDGASGPIPAGEMLLHAQCDTLDNNQLLTLFREGKGPSFPLPGLRLKTSDLPSETTVALQQGNIIH